MGDSPGQESRETMRLAIEGMTCAACVARVERALHRVPGVMEATVNLATERAQVTLGASHSSTTGAELMAAVQKAGYGARLLQAEAALPADAKKAMPFWPIAVGLMLCTPLTLPMLLMPFGIHWMLPSMIQAILATIVQVGLGARFYIGALRSLRDGVANMDVLVALGTTAAFGLSLYHVLTTSGTTALYFESSAMVITLVRLGKWLEGRAKGETTSAIRALAALRPETASVLRDGQEMTVGVEFLRVDDIVIVRPGSRIPCDGLIIQGESAVDESLVTGESLPVSRGVGQRVIGGAINGDGLLSVRVTAPAAESLLARMVRLVEAAQVEKGQIQRRVDQISAVFVPCVLALAFLTMGGWWWWRGDLAMAIIHGVSVLVISCPCALGLATPTAIMVGTGVAARHGILIRDVEALERAQSIDTVVLDKTGTLTQGQPTLTRIVDAVAEEGQILRVAASLQLGSEHPLARATLQKARDEGLSWPRPQDLKNRPGLGVEGWVEDGHFVLGSRRLMGEIGVSASELDALEDAEREARQGSGGPEINLRGVTRSFLAAITDSGPVLWGAMEFRDPLRPTSREAIATLHGLGIETILATGDHQGTAQAVAQELGIPRVYGETLPESKQNIVKELMAGGAKVAMVGDGVNDAPALAAAHLGIAMGSGTDVAMQAASMTLLRHDPRLIAAAIEISRRTYGMIQQNLFWAFVYNIVAIPLAAGGWLSPMVAGAAMAMSSVSVMGNALRLRTWKPTFFA